MYKEALSIPDSYHWHEALDRSYICCDMVDKLLLSHAAIKSSHELNAKAEAAHQLLLELYQHIGSREE